MDSDELEGKKERYMDRFSVRQWNWSSTLHLPSGCPRHRCIRFFERWLDDLKREEGSKDFRWVRVLEHDIRYPLYIRFEGDQFQVLVGGLRSRTQTWEKRWVNLTGGRACIQHFDQKDQMDTLREMLRTMDEDGELDLRHGH